MQLEEEYRRRWHEVSTEVTRRLDYQVLSFLLSLPLVYHLSIYLSPCVICERALVSLSLSVCVVGGSKGTEGIATLSPDPVAGEGSH